ncbi:MAG: NUDIX domain-containing protein [Dehalococcoidia bacterium]|nr:NUDIX domain-containing protein [Dehalococcoidia bacterium]
MTGGAQSPQDWPPRIVVCVGTVVLQDNRALLVRQARGHALAGRWSIPWGIVEPDETPEAAALRETSEEGGIKADIDGLLGIQNLPQRGWVGMIFLCHHVSGIPTPDGGAETDRAAYFSLEELTAIEEPIEEWCAWLVRRVLQGDYRTIPPKADNPFRPRLAFL